ncbi:MAG: hypothetical protein LBV22_00345, partial [Mycoplasmataceae bacterium]|nr:hypothetical protein [Mycoplasmataceae bacterium]
LNDNNFRKLKMYLQNYHLRENQSLTRSKISSLKLQKVIRDYLTLLAYIKDEGDNLKQQWINECLICQNFLIKIGQIRNLPNDLEKHKLFQMMIDAYKTGNTLIRNPSIQLKIKWWKNNNSLKNTLKYVNNFLKTSK